MIATDPLSLVFIFCFLLGFGFFLAASLMGHSHGGHAHVHFHFHAPSVHHAPAPVGGHVAHAPGVQTAAHAPNAHTSADNQQAAPQPHFAWSSYLNPTSIALFLLGFGFFGYLFHNLTPGLASLSLLLAFICGLVVAAVLLAALGRLMAGVEGSTEQDVVDRTGMIGKVSITIPEKGLGEIIYTSPAGMRKSIPARGLEGRRLERDLEVVVVNYQNGIAEVDTWEHFMHGETNFSDPAAPEELPEVHILLNQMGASEMEMLMQQEQNRE